MNEKYKFQKIKEFLNTDNEMQNSVGIKGLLTTKHKLYQKLYNLKSILSNKIRMMVVSKRESVYWSNLER